MKIYLVSSGEYSEYSINGVFDDSVKAEKFMHHFQHDRVEEHGLNPTYPDREGDRYRLVYVLANTHFKVSRVSNDGSSEGWEPYSWLGPYTKMLMAECSCYYFAKDTDAAYKIASDKVTALKAGSTFITYETCVYECDMLDDGRPDARHSHQVLYLNTFRIDGKTSVLVNKSII
jgi:hypothetical protein